MIYQKDISLELNNRIDLIKQEIMSGKISLLDLELKGLFNEMEHLIDVYNLEKYAATYVKICEMLERKFDELKKLLRSLDDDQKIINFLKKNPKDEDIDDIFRGCWCDIFNIEDLSLNFLTYAFNRFCKEKISTTEIEHLKKFHSNEEFLIEIPELQFIEKLNLYYDEIKEKLPCVYDQLFEGENEQIKLYEQFICLLHLLQLGRIKYHKETNMLYL